MTITEIRTKILAPSLGDSFGRKRTFNFDTLRIATLDGVRLQDSGGEFFKLTFDRLPIGQPSLSLNPHQKQREDR